MEERTQKLLILVGEEGSQFEARDFAKLSEIIINYLSTPNELYEKVIIMLIFRISRKSFLNAFVEFLLSNIYMQPLQPKFRPLINSFLHNL